MMKAFLKELNIEVEFEYTPEANIQQVREFAAEKMGCNPTQVDVRMKGKAPQTFHWSQ